MFNFASILYTSVCNINAVQHKCSKIVNNTIFQTSMTLSIFNIFEILARQVIWGEDWEGSLLAH